MASFVETEYIPPDLKPIILVSRISGMWPPMKKSCPYYLLTLIVFICIGIGCPFTQVMNVMFVDSVTDVMDQCLISITMIASTWKGVNLLMHHGKIREIFNLHREMLSYTNKKENGRFQLLVMNNVRLFYFFVGMYMCGWTGVCCQTIFSTPEKRLWPSTFFMPFDFAKIPAVYLGVLFYQGLSEVLFCVWNAMQDTYPIIMVLMLCEHVDQLQQRVMSLGIKKKKMQNGRESRLVSEVEYYEELKKCCVYYEKCTRFKTASHSHFCFSSVENILFSISSRFWRLLEDAVSTAFLFQFGASGFVICTSAYQLSTVNTINHFTRN